MKKLTREEMKNVNGGGLLGTPIVVPTLGLSVCMPSFDPACKANALGLKSKDINTQKCC